jgi:mannose-6-phosphate isomerase
MTADAEVVAGATRALVARLQQEADSGRALSDKEALVLTLNQQYPDDVGVMSAFFLNLVSLGSPEGSRGPGRKEERKRGGRQGRGKGGREGV